MIKRTQNKVAESRLTLPVVSAYGLLVWLASGMLRPYYVMESEGLTGGAWVQLGCLIISAVLMVVLNNSNALIRIYSRTVSSSYIMLTCAACFLFNSTSGAIVSLCVVAAYLCAFRSFQDKEAMGWTFYAFLCTGLASLVFPPILLYVPIQWLMMKLQLNSLCWRTFFASILGIIAPYWFAATVFLTLNPSLELITQNGNDYLEWFQGFFVVPTPPTLATFSVNQLATYGFLALLLLTGIVHYWHDSINDKIRTRQFFGCFIALGVLTAILIPLMPSCFDGLLQMLIINTSPLIAHFIALTRTKITNVAFYVIVVTTVLLTLFNLWMPSLSFS